MVGELMAQTKINEVGSNAIGTIGPGPRINVGEISTAEVYNFAQRIATNEFYDAVGELGANAAGGTFTLVVADALTTQRFRRPGQKANEHAKTMYSWLIENADTPENRKIIPRQCVDGRPVGRGSEPSYVLIGDHDSNHGKDDCGAEKRLPDILAFIALHADVLRKIAESEGVDVDDVSHSMIQSNAQVLLDESYPTNAMALRDSFTEVAGEGCISCLEGSHNEVVARKNRDRSITLNRGRVRDEYGTKLQAFNIDAGVFEDAAKVISITANEAKQKAIAMEYYNTATALVLTHHSLLYIS